MHEGQVERGILPIIRIGPLERIEKICKFFSEAIYGIINDQLKLALFWKIFKIVELKTEEYLSSNHLK